MEPDIVLNVNYDQVADTVSWCLDKECFLSSQVVAHNKMVIWSWEVKNYASQIVTPYSSDSIYVLLSSEKINKNGITYAGLLRGTTGAASAMINAELAQSNKYKFSDQLLGGLATTVAKMEGMSGKELANLIDTNEKKESKIEVVSLSVLMKDKRLDNDKGQINVTANCYLDERQMKDWAAAIDEEGIFDISSLVVNTKTQKHEPILLVSHEELELDSLCPFVLPQYGLAALSGDSLILLKDGELQLVAWIKGCESSYVVVCGDKLIGKNGKRLNVIQSSESKKLLEFDTDQFSIFPKDENSIYVVCWYDDFSSIIRIDVDKKEYSEIVRLPLVVLTVAANEHMTLALVENDVFLIDQEGKAQKFFKTGEYINDIVMSEEGLLVATDTHIVLAKNAREQRVLLDEGAKRLWCDGKDLYYQSMNNDLYLIELK